jgi:hypothetical protein
MTKHHVHHYGTYEFVGAAIKYVSPERDLSDQSDSVVVFPANLYHPSARLALPPRLLSAEPIFALRRRDILHVH